MLCSITAELSDLSVRSSASVLETLSSTVKLRFIGLIAFRGFTALCKFRVLCEKWQTSSHVLFLGAAGRRTEAVTSNVCECQVGLWLGRSEPVGDTQNASVGAESVFSFLVSYFDS